MKLEVPIDKNDYKYVKGMYPEYKTYIVFSYNDLYIYKLLEDDNFIIESSEIGATFDLTDVDYLFANDCIKFTAFLKNKLQKAKDDKLVYIYTKMIEFSEYAIKYDTCLCVDFSDTFI